MTHYDKEREADELWRSAPSTATNYGRNARTFYKIIDGDVMFFDRGSGFWERSIRTSSGLTGDIDTVARPQHTTKQPETAQDAIKQPDPVNHPKHYAIAPGVEAIDIIKASLTPEQFEGYLLGNFLKYRLRAGDKDDLQQDIAKSNWYRERLNQR